MTNSAISRLNDVAGTALLTLREQYKDVYFFFFEPDFWLFFYQISEEYTPDIHVLDITSNLPIYKRQKGQLKNDFLAPEDPIIYVGRPSSLIKLCKNPIVSSRQNPIIFASIPVYSHSLKIEIWKMPVNFKGFTSFCFPFVPFDHFLKITVGTFQEIFLHAPLYQTKSLKAVLSSLIFIFGQFERVYGVGGFSSEIAKGFLDICHSPKISPGRNNLILFDRTVDLQSLMNINDSYLGILEELGAWDAQSDKIGLKGLSKILGVSLNEAQNLPISTEKDPLFEKLKLLPLQQVIQNVSYTNVRNTTTERLVEDHQKVLSHIDKIYKNDFMIDLVLKIQRGEIDAKRFGRCVVLWKYGPSLAFRMLSSLHYATNSTASMMAATNSIASLLAATFGLTTFSRWNQIDEIAVKNVRIPPPNKVRAVANNLGTMQALLALILSDEWKRPKFPIQESYVSSISPLQNQKYRWFIGVIGGITPTELHTFKEIAKVCRPNDEFVFMSTEIFTSRQFMENAILS